MLFRIDEADVAIKIFVNNVTICLCRSGEKSYLCRRLCIYAIPKERIYLNNNLQISYNTYNNLKLLKLCTENFSSTCRTS